MPPKSQSQREAMYAALAGKSKLGIPKAVAREYLLKDKGGSLPKRAKKR